MEFPYTLILAGPNWRGGLDLPRIRPKQIHIVGRGIKGELLPTEYEFTEVLGEMRPWEMVSHVTNKVKYPYYVVSFGEPIKNELIERAEYLYNEELRPFCYLNSKHGRVYFRKLGFLGHGDNDDWDSLVREVLDPRLILDEL